MRQSIPIVLELLEAAQEPMSVEGIMKKGTFPSRSKTPQNTVARDIAQDIKENLDSKLVRMSYGIYALKAWSND